MNFGKEDNQNFQAQLFSCLIAVLCRGIWGVLKYPMKTINYPIYYYDMLTAEFLKWNIPFDVLD